MITTSFETLWRICQRREILESTERVARLHHFQQSMSRARPTSADAWFFPTLRKTKNCIFISDIMTWRRFLLYIDPSVVKLLKRTEEAGEDAVLHFDLKSFLCFFAAEPVTGCAKSTRLFNTTRKCCSFEKHHNLINLMNTQEALSSKLWWMIIKLMMIRSAVIWSSERLHYKR